MRFILVFSSLLVAAVLNGCAQAVMSKVTAFSGPEPIVPGTVQIVPSTSPASEATTPATESRSGVSGVHPDSGESLEFAHYRSIVASHLAGAGFTPTDEAGQYRAILSYDVQEMAPEGSPANGSFWVAGGYSPWRRSSVDVVYVDSERRRREYRRTVRLVLERNDAAAQRVYETTAVSEGSCDVLTVVFDEMVEALFTNYPQANGSIEKVTVNGAVRC